MDKKEKKMYQPQGVRISQGSAQDSSVVPAGPASSSGDGQPSTSKTTEGGVKTHISPVEGAAAPKEKEELDSEGDVTTVLMSSEDEAFVKESSPPIRPYVAQMVEEKLPTEERVAEPASAMEWDEARAAKRKMPQRDEDSDSSESSNSEEERLQRIKIARRKRLSRILSTPSEEDPPVPGPSKIKPGTSKSKLDLPSRPSEEAPSIVKLMKGYISKQKRLEIEEAKEDIAEKKREELRKKKEEKLRLEEEKKKQEERAKAEAKVLAEINRGKKAGSKEEEQDYISNMTSSDVAAMALEYLDHVETIRTKCGTMQGALSGELKRRKLSLDNMVRALHAKAEEKGDPQFLKNKIDELLKKNREEEEKKNREIQELKEAMDNLIKENKEMRKEIRLLRFDLEKKKDKEKQGKYDKKKEEGKYLPPERKEDDIHEVPATPLQETMKRCPSLVSIDEGPIMRPPLQGRSVPIPGSDLQQKKKVRKVGIKVVSNIQVKPPREKEAPKEIAKEDEQMEWDDTGFDWNEEIEKEEKAEEEKNNNILEPIVLIKEGSQELVRGSNLRQGKEKAQKGESWAEVTKKGRKNRKKGEEEEKKTSAKQKPVKERTRKPPKTAAVSIKGDVTKGFSYAEALRKARTNIKLEDLQIATPRIRRGLNGATIIEISGPECQEKARKLADRMKDVLREDGAAITTPIIKGELRLTGLDESISKEEVIWAIQEEGSCDQQDIHVGEIRRSRRGMGVAWVKCPLKAATEISKKRKMKVGWTVVGVTLLGPRPLQCFRCWCRGHVKDTCCSNVDRSRLCYQCGREGHTAVVCKNPVNCAVCENLGRDSKHRVGSVKCEGVKSARKRTDNEVEMKE